MRVETTQNQKPPEEVDMLPPQNGRTPNPKTSGLLVGENKNIVNCYVTCCFSQVGMLSDPWIQKLNNSSNKLEAKRVTLK